MTTIPLNDIDAKDPPSYLSPASYFNEGEPQISDEARKILTRYSGVPEDAINTHIKQIRDKAWAVFPYPCIGVFSFVDLAIGSTPQYEHVLARLKKGDARMLDLGCCFGADIRKMVFDGAPATSIVGSELHPEFIELGYELFRDKAKLSSKFTSGDFFHTNISALKDDIGQFDYIHAGLFYHLFDWPDQVEALSRSLALLKPEPGAMIFGRQTGGDVAGPIAHDSARTGTMYRHDEKSFSRLVAEVSGKLGVKLDCAFQKYGSFEPANKENEVWNLVHYHVTRV